MLELLHNVVMAHRSYSNPSMTQQQQQQIANMTSTDLEIELESLHVITILF
jgi:hypothetical protein